MVHHEGDGHTQPSRSGTSILGEAEAVVPTAAGPQLDVSCRMYCNSDRRRGNPCDDQLESGKVETIDAHQDMVLPFDRSLLFVLN